MASTHESSEIPVVQAIECNIPQRNYTDWLGLTHLMIPHAYDFEKFLASHPEFNAYERLEANTLVFSIMNKGFEKVDLLHIRNAGGPSTALLIKDWYFADLQGKTEFTFAQNRAVSAGDRLTNLLKGHFPVQATVYIDEEGLRKPLPSVLKDKLVKEYGPQAGCIDPEATPPIRVPIKISSTAVSMQVSGESHCPALLSLPWTAMPGWLATINDQRSPIFRVGDTTLGLMVPKGKWSVQLLYEPKYLGLSLFISLATFLITLILVGLGTIFPSRFHTRRHFPNS